MQPLVTVIIPSYNCEKYITETINSVFEQDYPSIELIIIDDGSTDNTCHIIEQYGKRLRLIQQPNAGVCSARNRGIKEANGDYICLMDHDDYWFPDKISLQVKTFQNHPDAGIVYSNFKRWYPNGEGMHPVPNGFRDDFNETEIDEPFSGWIYHQLLLDCWVLTSTAMIRRDVFETCGVFDESLPFSEDWDLWLRVSLHYPFVKLRHTTTLYREHIEQGNRKVRPIDYRTVLLQKYKRQWGLCSKDGRCLTERQFKRQLAEYHALFGLHHLSKGGDFSKAISSLLNAWLSYPFKLKYLAYLMAALFGWKPDW